ncbi:MAG: hypothetical protein HYZ44_07060 [Bacteroidetes bacterium]|nr:hypothetical protein [Bacteroidota bacterium]
MKKPFLLFAVLLCGSSAVAQTNYETEYARVMAIVNKWESQPDSLTSVNYKRSAKGRTVRMKMRCVEKVPTKTGVRYVANERKYKLKHTHKGMVETTRIYVSGARVGFIRKVDGKYQVAETFSDIILLDKIVITHKHKQRNTYYKPGL